MEDINLVKKAIKGNKESLKALINMYIDDIYRLAYLKSKHEDDANKIVKETVSKVFKEISLLKEMNGFKVYIYNIFFKTANEYLNDIGMVDLEHSKDSYTKEEKINLYNTLDEIEDIYKDVVILRYICSLEMSEISNILELSNEDTINNLYKAICGMKLLTVDNEEHKLNEEELKNISIENVDSIMEEFYINKDEINLIKPSTDIDGLIKESLEKGELYVKKKNRKKYILACITLAFFIGGYSLISKPRYKVYSTPEESIVEIGSDEKSVKIPENELECIMLIHKMSNSIIIPKDNKKYGSIEITPKTIEIAINSLKYVKDEKANSYLKEALNSWKNGDFVNGVQVHNYVWRALDGEVGKASSINELEVKRIIQTHFK